MPADVSFREILPRIDREIEALLRHGKLSPLEYEIPVSKQDRSNRKANLKALLAARRHYRKLLDR
jgi:hypothetical protein